MKLTENLILRIKNNDTSLTSINLWGNDIGAEGAKAIAEALKSNTSLTSIDLGITTSVTKAQKPLPTH